METYYQDRDVRIGPDGIRMNGHGLRPGDLLRVWHRTGRRSLAVLAGRGALGMAMLAPLARIPPPPGQPVEHPAPGTARRAAPVGCGR